MNSEKFQLIRSINIKPLNFVAENLKYISREKFQLIIRSRVIPGDILLVKVGINLGDACIFPHQFCEAVLSTTGSCKITPNNKLTNTNYLVTHLFLMKEKLQIIASESAQPFLNMTTIKELPILLPPLKLQEKFAKIVQKYERIRKQQQEAQRQADHLFQSLLHQFFSQ